MYLNEKANEQAEEIAEILEPAKEVMEEMKLDIPDGYEFFGIDDNKIVLTKKQHQYPKTYVECCGILDVEPYSRSAGYKSDLITAFRNLLICRDAYWKIAGEQMGLGKPWEPDWNDSTKIKYCITTVRHEVEYFESRTINIIIAFPTKEIRDDFDNNFNNLMDVCKELL